MDSHSLSHNPPVPWSYPDMNSVVGTWPGSSRPIKRPHSESDDCDDVFSEESSKEQYVFFI